MSETTAVMSETHGNLTDVEYRDFLVRFEANFLDQVRMPDVKLFTVNLPQGKHVLWDAYLTNIDASLQQRANCATCRGFIQRFGRIVIIHADGTTRSPLWNPEIAPDYLKASFQAMKEIVESAKIADVFISDREEWGHHETDEWIHLAITPPAHLVYRNIRWTAHQTTLNYHMDFVQTLEALKLYPKEVVVKAKALMDTGTLNRSEKFEKPLEWFLDLQEIFSNLAYAKTKINRIWLAVATAPTGFARIKNSVIGPVLDDLVIGTPVNVIKRKHAEKTAPTKYQTPQKEPTKPAILQHQAIIEKIGLAESLRRKACPIEDIVETLWVPSEAKQPESQNTGVFKALLDKQDAVSTSLLDIGQSTMTWEKFERDILPTARKIEVQAYARSNYGGLITAVSPDAPPILKYDRLDRRNPVSWYVSPTGRQLREFGLAPGWIEIKVITHLPCHWFGQVFPLPKTPVLIFPDARDHRPLDQCLFPELVISDLWDMRATIKAYSDSTPLENQDKPFAVGLFLQGNQTWNQIVRVTTDTTVGLYNLDRLE